MSRILLVDDSPHAQRMGERILTEEGFEVVTVSNADSALIRMDDVDPDLVVADTVMPGRSGYDVCQFVKMSPRHRHVRVVLTAGVLEPLDEEQVKRVQADATVQKPFEASVLIATVRPLAERASMERANKGGGAAGQSGAGSGAAPAGKGSAVPFAAVVDAEQIKAAVTVALDASMESMVDEITARVLAALQPRKPAPASGLASTVAPSAARAAEVAAASKSTTPAMTAPPPVLAPARLKPLIPAVAPAASSPSVRPAAAAPPPKVAGSAPPPRLDTVRRVNTLRSRPGSILGLELNYAEPEVPSAAPSNSNADPLYPNSRPAADPDPTPGSRSAPTDPDKK